MSINMAACSKAPKDLIVGVWSCNAKENSMTMSGDYEYVSNGTTNLTFEAQGYESGTKLSFSGIAQGTWSIKKNELLEKLEKLTIVSFSVDGKNLSPESLPEEIKNALVGASTGTNIIQLDERVLLLQNGSTQITCTRK